MEQAEVDAFDHSHIVEIDVDTVLLHGFELAPLVAGEAEGGEAVAIHSTFSSPKSHIHLWPGTQWSGDNNVFDVSGIRFENRWFYAKDAKAFAELFKSDSTSRWLPQSSPP